MHKPYHLALDAYRYARRACSEWGGTGVAVRSSLIAQWKRARKYHASMGWL